VKAVTVTIGRGVGTTGAVLGDDEWSAFVTGVRTAMSAELWVDADYDGSWNDIAEPAHVFYGPIDDGAVEVLRADLGQLAGRFGQDAIGFTVGEAGLVTV
jgi:hypothetical protein